MAAAEVPQRQVPAGAALPGVQATFGKAAARLRVNGALKLADELHPLHFLPAAGDGNGRQQSLGIGMQWLAEQLRGIRCLHQLAQVHHRDLIGEELHHRQVMGDKEIGQVELRLQILQQVQDLSLDGHVQRGHRLVADDELGLQGRCPPAGGGRRPARGDRR